jgi:hypothetical protein
MVVHLQWFPLGDDFLDSGTQIRRHREVLQGRAPGHWQYRFLSEWVAQGFIQLSRWLELRRPIAAGFLLFRVAQNLAIFGLLVVYYRKLGLDTKVILLGMSALAWGMTNARYDSDLSFNTYSDMIFYLGAALLILARSYLWLVPLSVAAALNRETAALIPVMALLHEWMSPSAEKKPAQRFGAALVALALFAITFVAVRQTLGPRAEFPTFGSASRGWETVFANATRPWTWSQLLATNGWLPFLAVAAIKRWPPSLLAFFWAIVPAWYAVHFAWSTLAETRLVLVPLAIVFVPGALLGLTLAERRQEVA